MGDLPSFAGHVKLHNDAKAFRYGKVILSKLSEKLLTREWKRCKIIVYVKFAVTAPRKEY